jgi:hypothetical protein
VPAIDATLGTNIMEATLPCGTTGKPSVAYWLTGGLSASGGMKLRLTTSLSTESSAGATLTGTGSGDYTITTSSSGPSSTPLTVTLPAVSGGTGGTTYWTNGSGSPWALDSVECQDNANTRAWYGPITGEPVAVAVGDSFAFGQNSITAELN